MIMIALKHCDYEYVNFDVEVDFCVEINNHWLHCDESCGNYVVKLVLMLMLRLTKMLRLMFVLRLTNMFRLMFVLRCLSLVAL